MNERMDGCIDECIDEWMDDQMISMDVGWNG
jgi:hypothetical protein